VDSYEKLLRRWAESLAGLARTGIGFTENQYERERYEEILAVAGEIKAVAEEGLIEGRDETGPVHEWMREQGVGVHGYQTPKVAIGAAVYNDRHELLMIQRSDSGLWLYPTGWCDIGYSAPEVAVKEVREETGVDVVVERLIGVMDGMRLGTSRTPLYSLLFLCRATSTDINFHPLECTDAGWFAESSLPEPTIGQQRWAPHIFASIRGEATHVQYDDLRQPVWRGGE
jgi:ADP-ribose pyrophosphatase YjhB (NUDIX family)